MSRVQRPELGEEPAWYEIQCSFCLQLGRGMHGWPVARPELPRIVMGPGIAICERCVQLATEVSPDLWKHGDEEHQCSFDLARRPEPNVFMGPGAAICERCVQLANELFAEDNERKHGDGQPSP